MEEIYILYLMTKDEVVEGEDTKDKRMSQPCKKKTNKLFNFYEYVIESFI